MEKLKRLDLWLPENHPIFNYPPRSRTQIAKTLLDVGTRLERIEGLLERHDYPKQPIEPLEPANPTPPKINVEKLMKRVNELF